MLQTLNPEGSVLLVASDVPSVPPTDLPNLSASLSTARLPWSPPSGWEPPELGGSVPQGPRKRGKPRARGVGAGRKGKAWGVGRWSQGFIIKHERVRSPGRGEDKPWGASEVCTPWAPGPSCSAERNTKRWRLGAALHLRQAIDRRSSERDRQTVTGKMNCHLPFFRGAAG